MNVKCLEPGSASIDRPPINRCVQREALRNSARVVQIERILSNNGYGEKVVQEVALKKRPLNRVRREIYEVNEAREHKIRFLFCVYGANAKLDQVADREYRKPLSVILIGSTRPAINHAAIEIIETVIMATRHAYESVRSLTIDQSGEDSEVRRM